MQKKNGEGRLLARRLATEIPAAKLGQVSGAGISWYGTGSVDSRGVPEDVRSGDTVPGMDVFHPRAGW